MKKNSKNKNRRAQTSKPAKSGNTAYMEGMMQIRYGNAAQPHKNKARYDRKRDKREWSKNL